MKILVPVKRVVDYNVKVRVKADGSGVDLANVKMSMNPFDEIAVEEAVRLKEAGIATEVIAVSCGVAACQETLRTAMAIGADRGILVDCGDVDLQPLAVAKLLKVLCDKEQPQLVICGKQAIDGDTAQVGPSLAEQLDVPHATYVRKVQSLEDNKIVVERMTEDGYEVIELALPALITVLKDINQPRLPSLKGKMRAKKAEIPVWGKEDLDVDEKLCGLAGSPTQVVKIFTPERTRECRLIEGSAEEQAKVLASELKKII